MAKKYIKNREGVVSAITTENLQLEKPLANENYDIEVHNRNIFINYQQAWGDLNAFVKKYGIAMSDNLKEKLNKYIDRSMMYDSNDFGVLKLSDTLLNLK